MCSTIYEWIMTLESGTIGNIITFITAIVAIVALILQSRSTRKQIKLQNFIEYTKRYQEILLHFPENVNETDFSFEKMDKIERDKTLRYMRAYYDLCFEEFMLHKKGFIDNDLWEIWKSGMKFAFSKTAFKKAWSIIKQDTSFSPEFEQFVNIQVNSSS